jgi:hypothetical protein
MHVVAAFDEPPEALRDERLGRRWEPVGYHRYAHINSFEGPILGLLL